MHLSKLLEEAFERTITEGSETQPFEHASLDTIVAGAGVRKDQRPAVFKPEIDPTIQEEERNARRRLNDRKARARARRQQAAADFEAAHAPEIERYGRAVWQALGPMYHIITEATRARSLRFSRRAHAEMDDLTSRTAEMLHRALCTQAAKHEVTEKGWPLETIERACAWLGGFEHLPGDITVRAIPRDEEASRCAEWVMKALNMKATAAIHEWHQLHPNVETIDTLETIIRSLDGEDEYLTHAGAKRRPMLQGYHWPQPGKVDWEQVAVQVADHITARRLDPLAVALLDEENQRVDGSIMWSDPDVAATLWSACGMPASWDNGSGKVVHFAALSHKRRADLVRDAVRNRMAFLPQAIADAISNQEPGWGEERQTRVVQFANPHDRAKTAAREMLRVIDEVIHI